MLAEEITRLARAYFHQDYDLEYDSPIQALEDYREVHDEETVSATREALQDLIDSGVSEEELAALWLEEGLAYYDPRDDGISVSDWFRKMVDALT
ncbi:contact-dependent growth inhibition system immunity protein [Streptomyces sp. NPDC052701]|uniref:contact-dependent growth inhibition system immunity protein n=1 Tax=Streptomyces sp. NPDC052701 TaxID=3155533 RepID=UPI00342CADC8